MWLWLCLLLILLWTILIKGSPIATTWIWTRTRGDERSRSLPRSWSTVTTLVHYESLSLTGQFRNLWQCFLVSLFMLLCLVYRFVVNLLVIVLWTEHFFLFALFIFLDELMTIIYNLATMPVQHFQKNLDAPNSFKIYVLVIHVNFL